MDNGACLSAPGSRPSDQAPAGLDAPRVDPSRGWRCRRCGQDVDYEAFRCGCTTSPSPWEPKP